MSKEWVVESHYDYGGIQIKDACPWVCSRENQLEFPMELEACVEAIRHEFTREDLDADAIERVWIRNINTGEIIPGSALGI